MPDDTAPLPDDVMVKAWPVVGMDPDSPFADHRQRWAILFRLIAEERYPIDPETEPWGNQPRDSKY